LEQQSRFLRDLGVAVDVKRFEGGHRLDDATLHSFGSPLGVEDILNLSHPDPELRIPYGKDLLQFGELRIPEGDGPHPVAIVIHGGCWRARYDVSHTRAFTEALRKNGLAVWSLEYRRVGNEGGGWPGTFLDVAAGADHLRQLAPTHRIDLGRAVVFGHSAGGHLALWLAARGGLGEKSEIRGSAPFLELKGVVTLAAVTDLERALQEGVCDSMAAELLGGVPASVPSRYREASPVDRLPIGVPQRLLTGAADTIVPPKFGEDYAARASSLGDDVTHSIIEDAGHFEGIAPGTRAFHAVLEAIRSLAARWE
jgi:acetyl esterase/lipase